MVDATGRARSVLVCFFKLVSLKAANATGRSMSTFVIGSWGQS